MKIQSWDAFGQVDEFVALCRELLPRETIGVYVHGSAVSKGLRPRSDIDLLLVTEGPISDSVRGALLARLLGLSAHYPAQITSRRCLDILAVSKAEIKRPTYPAACEFLFGEWLRQDFENGDPLHPFTDPVVTLLLAQAWGEAEAVFGPDFQTVAGEVPALHMRRALLDSLPALVADLDGDERNVLLTLARMWRTALEGDFVAKDVAAAWAAPRLPDDLGSALLDAGRGYRGEFADEWSTRQTEVLAIVDHIERELTALLAPVD